MWRKNESMLSRLRRCWHSRTIIEIPDCLEVVAVAIFMVRATPRDLSKQPRALEPHVPLTVWRMFDE